MHGLLHTLVGNPGHGSRFIENTAAEKAQYLMNQILGYRQKQKKLLEANPDLTLGDVTTVNMTMISGGVQMNVVPNEFTLGFDFRITPTTNLVGFDEMLRKWSEEVRYKFLLTLSSGVVLQQRSMGISVLHKCTQNLIEKFLAHSVHGGVDYVFVSE